MSVIWLNSHDYANYKLNAGSGQVMPKTPDKVFFQGSQRVPGNSFKLYKTQYMMF